MATAGSGSISGAETNQRRIQDKIKRYVLDNDLAPGEPMPTEPVLMNLLGISRNALREAMKALQALGYIQIRHGFGTYVGNPTLDPLREGLIFRMTRSREGDLTEISNLLEVRQALEIGFADDVVRHYREHSTRHLVQLVETMEADGAAGKEFMDSDLAFHLALCAPLDNALITDLLTVFWRSFHEIDPRLPRPTYSPAETAGWHRAIVQALDGGDTAEYMVRMREHFAGIRARLMALDAGAGADRVHPRP